MSTYIKRTESQTPDIIARAGGDYDNQIKELNSEITALKNSINILEKTKNYKLLFEGDFNNVSSKTFTFDELPFRSILDIEIVLASSQPTGLLLFANGDTTLTNYTSCSMDFLNGSFNYASQNNSRVGVISNVVTISDITLQTSLFRAEFQTTCVDPTHNYKRCSVGAMIKHNGTTGNLKSLTIAVEGGTITSGNIKCYLRPY